MRILLSNDDGVHALGLLKLYRELKKLGQVWVVAPLAEKSTTGHSLTIHKPLRLLEIKKDFYGVSGSPADCIYLGVRQVIGEMPDLVVSGINRGANLGQDVYYSGTVSAAREGSILGLPALAVSLVLSGERDQEEEELHYTAAAKVTVEVIQKLQKFKWVPNTLFNLNVPDLPFSQIKEVRLTRQGFRFYSGEILKRNDHRGRPYYWLGGSYRGYRPEEGTDCDAVAQQCASLTPLQLDCTDVQTLKNLNSAGFRKRRSSSLNKKGV